MTIERRLSLWYMLVTLAIVLVFGLGTYLGMRHTLYSALEKERQNIASRISASYDPVTHTFRDLEPDIFHTNRYMKELFLRLYNASGEAIYDSPMANRLRTPMPFSREQVEETVVVRQSLQNGDMITMQASSRRIIHNNKTVGWLDIALPIRDIEESMANLLKILLVGGVVVVFLVGVGSRYLTRKVLHPVAAITRKAREISSSNLSERIEIFNRQDELGQLSIVLNNLLERLENTFDSQRQFMADAAHELKTPLSILRAGWEEQLDNPNVSQSIKEKLTRDVETISRLNHIITNLLLLSQSEAARMDFAKEKVTISDLLQDVVADSEILAEMKSQTLQLKIDRNGIVLGDKARLYQLFFNLIDNAVKYTNEGGVIGVHLTCKDNRVFVRIRDNGVGISAHDLERIFERFYRVHKDRSRKTGGSGLGLSICKLIAESHNGHISVTSKPNEGSTFTVELPAVLD